MNKLLRTFMLTLLVLGLAVSGAMASTVESYTQMIVVEDGSTPTDPNVTNTNVYAKYNSYSERDLNILLFSGDTKAPSITASGYTAKKLLVPANYNFEWKISLPKVYAFYAMNNGGGNWTQLPKGAYAIDWTVSVDKSSTIIVNKEVYDSNAENIYITGAYPKLGKGEMATVKVQLIGKASLTASGKENFDFTRLYSIFGNNGNVVYTTDLLVQGVADKFEIDDATFAQLARITEGNVITVVSPDYEIPYGVGAYKMDGAVISKPTDIVALLNTTASSMTVSYDVSPDVTSDDPAFEYLPDPASFDKTFAKPVLSLDLTLISYDMISVPTWLHIYSKDITTKIKETYSLDMEGTRAPNDAEQTIWPAFDSGDIQMIIAYSKDIVDKVNAGKSGTDKSKSFTNTVTTGTAGRVVIPVKMHAEGSEADKATGVKASKDVYSFLVWDVVYGGASDSGSDTPTPTPSTDELAISASTTSATGTVGTAISPITVTATTGTPTKWEFKIVNAAGTELGSDDLGLTFTDSADMKAEVIAGTPKISGDFTITVYASDATTEKSVDIALKVSEAGSGETGSFTIAADPASLTVTAGGDPVTATLSATGATGVEYSVTGETWGTVSAATFTAAPDANVAANDYTFTITGTETATSKTATTTITVKVDAADNNSGGDETPAAPTPTDENGNSISSNGLTDDDFANAMGTVSARTVTLTASEAVQAWTAIAYVGNDSVDNVTASAADTVVTKILLSVNVNDSATSAGGGLVLTKDSTDNTKASLTIDPTKFTTGSTYVVKTRYTDNAGKTSPEATAATFEGKAASRAIYGGGSSGGCDAGFGALALAAVSLFLLKRRS